MATDECWKDSKGKWHHERGCDTHRHEHEQRLIESARREGFEACRAADAAYVEALGHPGIADAIRALQPAPAAGTGASPGSAAAYRMAYARALADVEAFVREECLPGHEELLLTELARLAKGDGRE